MILSHPKSPLAFGTAMIGLLAVYLALYHPTPGPLASPHAIAVGGAWLATCKVCHADEGLTQGCLHCHVEIAAQVRTDKGYHAFLLQGKELACAPCHPDHLGDGFPLTGQLAWGQCDPNRFDHSHVRFALTGAHEALACARCHRPPEPFSLPNFPAQIRPVTYLGLSQDCVGCHEDVHAGVLSRSCQLCHSQETFRPAVHFRHDDHYKLEGAHAKAACADCHLVAVDDCNDASPVADINDLRLAFDQVKGTACADCHETPHRTSWSGDCIQCHLAADETWAKGTRGIQAETHAQTGFPLGEAHGAVACEKCHAPGLSFDRRYPDPGAADYKRHPKTCEGCHADPHGGQFRARHTRCRDCHEQERFLPAGYDITQHAGLYPLTGVHAGVACIRCHILPEGASVRRFASTPRECKTCHADPHGGQFEREMAAGDCTACHRPDAGTFAIRPYDHAGRTGYSLTGAHQKPECVSCHRQQKVEMADGSLHSTPMYRGTPTACHACHADVHRGQFRKNEEQDCRRCHASTEDWTADRFDHNRDARFSLEGVHEGLPCSACHPSVRQPDGQNVIQYRPLGTRCEDCHAFLPK